MVSEHGSDSMPLLSSPPLSLLLALDGVNVCVGMKSSPRLTHDEFAIVNPDFWDHGVDQNAFKGWMRMTTVCIWFLCFNGLLNLPIVGPGTTGSSPSERF